MAKGFQNLPGFRDFFPNECAARNVLFEKWRTVAHRYGFVEYDGPILEPTELYQKKSGDEIQGQLFCFEDKGERNVSMRPELTPTLARMAAARQRDFKKPLRWFSIGQFFRYEKPQKGRGREFYQFNCDILGEKDAAADAELIALSIDLMRELGFTIDDFRIRLSDRTAWTDFAERSGVPEERTTDFLQIIDKLERERPEKTTEKLAEFGLTTEQVETFVATGADASETLQQVTSDLTARGLGDFVEIDLKIVRGLAYYTGTVFEIFDIGKGMRAVAGGGRYNGLLKLIGGVDMPACGFAMGDMVITDLIRESKGPNAKLEAGIREENSIDVFVAIADEAQRPAALALTQRLRTDGYRTNLALTPAKLAKQFQAAEQANAAVAVVIGDEYPTVSLKQLGRGESITCEIAALDTQLKELLAPN